MSSSENIEMEMLGFGCASCVYTIERTGRKIPGVEEIRVNLADQRIRIRHSGNRKQIIDTITDIVKRIGHEVRDLTPEAI